MRYEAAYYGRYKKVDRAFADTREEAAAILFARNPKCKSAQCCNAYVDDKGVEQGNGNDIRWIDRPR